MSSESVTTPKVELDVRTDRSILTIEGQRNVAVVVRSKSGERIYLPPEDAVEDDERQQTTSPYSPGTDDEEDDQPIGTTTRSADRSSPYQRGDEQTGDMAGRSGGLHGLRIIHPEPVTDFRVLR
jgi:hypothetical protein